MECVQSGNTAFMDLSVREEFLLGTVEALRGYLGSGNLKFHGNRIAIIELSRVDTGRSQGIKFAQILSQSVTGIVTEKGLYPRIKEIMHTGRNSSE